MNYELADVVEYLNSKKVPFLLQTYPEYKIKGIEITKQGKFFRANEKIICANMINVILKYS